MEIPQSARQHLARQLVWACCCLLWAGLAGCRPSQPQAAPAKAPTSGAEGSAGQVGAATGQGSPSGPQLPSPAAATDPETLLRQVIQRYQQATAYQDQAVERLSYVQPLDSPAGAGQAERVSVESPVSVAFRRRPAALRARIHQTEVICDGELLQARVFDEATRDLDGQVLRRPCERLTLDALDADGILANLLDRSFTRRPLTLELLLSPQPLAELLDPQVSKQWAAGPGAGPLLVEGRECRGVAVASGGQQVVFWIDSQDGVIRQIDYPPPPLDGQATDARLSVVFHQAEFDARQDRFQWTPPADAKRVQYFVPPPQPLPTELYGKQVGELKFTDVQGAPVSSEQWAGRPVVLVWFSSHPVCRPTLEQLQLVRSQWGEERVTMVAVATEPAEVSGEELVSRLQGWPALPMVRDLAAVGRDQLAVPSVPTLVVLDAQGRLQVFDEGYNPQLPAELDLVLGMLEQGRDVSELVLRRARSEQAAYAQDLIAAGASGVEAAFPVAEASLPSKRKLTRRWKAEGVRQPGSLAAYRAADGSARLAVLDGLRTLVLLDDQGRQLLAKELDLPASVGVNQLRSLTLSDGASYFAVYSPGGEQVFLLDQQGRLLLRHPEQPLHAGVLDATLWEEDHQPRLGIGYRDGGLHAVDVSGRRLWVSRQCGSPFTVDTAATRVGPRLVAADPQGQLHVLTTEGQSAGPPLQPGGWPIYQAYTGRFSTLPESGATLCGVSLDALGQRAVIGLSQALVEQWRLTLPAGMYPSPLRMLAGGELAGGACWVAAGPDGSLHWVAADGSERDQWSVGQEIRGLAITTDRGLCLATPQGLECWEVE